MPRVRLFYLPWSGQRHGIGGELVFPPSWRAVWETEAGTKERIDICKQRWWRPCPPLISTPPFLNDLVDQEIFACPNNRWRPKNTREKEKKMPSIYYSANRSVFSKSCANGPAKFGTWCLFRVRKRKLSFPSLVWTSFSLLLLFQSRHVSRMVGRRRLLK